ncbi:class II aldolase/adducin family protein [Gemmatimonas groenlandica]|uniref:Class II aldolase/adducin family protein n=1 Tax=Gemmatimonas groenlandica TaxID=2732249 RepID=A0A6M4IMN9_9BACT|nr:class II aldolase/adducin family protein [Gemmatimonas groenlandica]QJR35178.1 class II aldolase/adducin family protein [Gemmatimonas groenlandica]
MTDEHGLRVMLAAACRRLHARGLLAGAEGNLSCRLSDGDLLVTASGVDKGTIDHTQVIRVHADGTPCHEERAQALPGDPRTRDTTRRASSELGMHLACYAARADVQAIVHAHPPAATGFAAAGIPMPADVLPELPVVVGPIALVPYGRPGTPALADAMRPFLATHEVFLLANHGVTALGTSIEDALLRMESVEQSARILAVARLLGGAQSLPPTEAAVLASLHPRYEDASRTNSA